MKILGIVMAKSGSTRTPNKNIADISGRPSLSYPIEALRTSGICNPIIVSTDSEQYADIALRNGADGVTMRTPLLDRYAEFSVSADDARQQWEMKTGDEYDAMIVSGGNVLFLRPSWVRAAAALMTDFVYNLMPIDVVGMEPVSWGVNLCRVRRGIMTQSNFFVFKHYGLLVEVDYPHELKLARDIRISIDKGVIEYPLDENIHEDILAGREKSPNRMRGLMLKSQLYGNFTTSVSDPFTNND